MPFDFAKLRRVLELTTPSLLVVWGPQGVGKSTLMWLTVQALLEEASTAPTKEEKPDAV